MRQQKRKRASKQHVVDDDALLQARLAKIGERFMSQFEGNSDTESSDVGKNVREEEESERESESDSETGGGESDSEKISSTKQRKLCKENEHINVPRKSRGRDAKASLSTQTITQSKEKVVPFVVDATCYSNMSNKHNDVAMRKARDSFLSANVSSVHQHVGRKKELLGLKDKVNDNYMLWMEDVHKQVEKLGASTLTGRAKKEYEANEIVKLGGNAPKNIKVPLIIKTGMNQKAKERALKLETDLKNTGMYVKKAQPKVRRSKSDRGLDSLGTIGQFKDGVLKVNKSMLTKKGAKKGGSKKK
eukprot:CFRG1109T1